MLVPGAAIIDRAAASEADKITDAASVGDQAAKFAITDLLPLDGADGLLYAFGRKVFRSAADLVDFHVLEIAVGKIIGLPPDNEVGLIALDLTSISACTTAGNVMRSSSEALLISRTTSFTWASISLLLSNVFAPSRFRSIDPRARGPFGARCPSSLARVDSPWIRVESKFDADSHLPLPQASRLSVVGAAAIW